MHRTTYHFDDRVATKLATRAGQLDFDFDDRERTQHLIFAQIKGEFNPHFQRFFGTNWDKTRERL